MIPKKGHIINVERKPSKCPVCGERVVDIIYGTGDMTEVEFLFEYRREGMMGGDNIPRNPPIWECVCGCKRFRKVDFNGNIIPVKPKMLKNIRKKPATLITWTTEMAGEALNSGQNEVNENYRVKITTDLGEEETLSVYAFNKEDAIKTAKDLVLKHAVGLKGDFCMSAEIINAEK